MKKLLPFVIFLLLFSCAFEEPYFMTIYANSSSDKIQIDGNFARISDISAAIQMKTRSLDSVQKSKFFVKLKFEKGITSGMVSDIKHELRKANCLNVRYYLLEDSNKNHY